MDNEKDLWEMTKFMEEYWYLENWISFADAYEVIQDLAIEYKSSWLNMKEFLELKLKEYEEIED